MNDFKAGDIVSDGDGRELIVVEVLGGEHDGRLGMIRIARWPGEDGAVLNDSWWS